MKTISADGKYVIAGSANKDQTTMFGSFREEQMDVADENAAAEHDRVFLAHWNDSNESEEVHFDHKAPAIKDGNGLSINYRQFLGLVRNALSLAYDAREL